MLCLKLLVNSSFMDRLTKRKSTKRISFQLWQNDHAAYLTSVATGGQWPQARAAASSKWTDDTRCQLCHGDTGTLAHRLECPAIKPLGGWQQHDKGPARLLGQLDAQRATTLATRGLMVLRIAAPPAPVEASFRWLLQPPDDTDHRATWFIDGSMYDEYFMRRLGYGIAVVDSGTYELVGIGLGIPPNWILDSAGAETWAFYQVVAMNPFTPNVVTDCQGILNTLNAGPKAAVGEYRKLARLWHLIGEAADWSFAELASRTTKASTPLAIPPCPAARH